MEIIGMRLLHSVEELNILFWNDLKYTSFRKTSLKKEEI